MRRLGSWILLALITSEAGAQDVRVSINEVRVDQPGPDSQIDVDEFFELRGNPGDSLNAYAYVVLDGLGVVESVIPLDGHVIPPSHSPDGFGYFLGVGSGFTIAGTTPDLTAATLSLGFSDCHTVTHIIVSDPNHAVAGGQDWDSMNTGSLVIPPELVMAGVSLVHDLDNRDKSAIGIRRPAGSTGACGTTMTDFQYGPPFVASERPSLAYDCDDDSGWRSGELADSGTPGVPNSGLRIGVQPNDVVGCLGGTVTFHVGAYGCSASYQWRKDGAVISGAEEADFTITGVNASDVGSYDVTVDDGTTIVSSRAATLIVDALYTCRAGTVNSGVGQVADVLKINGMIGDDQRRLVLTTTESFTLRMEAPPEPSTRNPAAAGVFALYAWVLPRGTTELTCDQKRDFLFGPNGPVIGTLCMPTPFLPPGGGLIPYRYWNNGRPRFDIPGRPKAPSGPAPTILMNRPGGVGPIALNRVVFLQGLIHDEGAQAMSTSVTNGILVEFH